MTINNCSVHIEANVKQHFGEKAAMLFGRAANALKKDGFYKALGTLAIEYVYYYYYNFF